MAQWHHSQRDFSGGVISERMNMRADTEVYQKSCAKMENFQPTMQGSARRMPGTRFVRDIGNVNARIIPFLTTANERSLLVLTPLAAKLINDVTDEILPDRITRSKTVQINGAQTKATVVYRQPLYDDPNFDRNQGPWEIDPDGLYTGANGDYPLGAQWQGGDTNGRLYATMRYYKRPNVEGTVATFTSTREVTYATTVATVAMEATYLRAIAAEGNYKFTVDVSKNADYSDPLFTREFREDDFPPGSSWNVDNENFALDGGAPWTGTLYTRLRLEVFGKNGGTLDNKYSHVEMIVSRFQLWADNEVELTEEDVVTPFESADLEDIHYVQSPYGDPDGFKELVLTHPRHPPQRFYFDPLLPGYTMEAIPFVDENDDPNPPSEWTINNYPATCTSYHGRLVLAGGQTFKVKAGDPIASVSETVWCTEVTKWDTFSTETGVNPDDSIEFTAVYRSPIQWTFGGKTLLIGSLEYEYSASGEGIFSPGDLGVFLHTTHGSTNVQPAAFGEAVMFPADAGTKVRSMTYNLQSESWVATDLTMLNPEIVYPKIVRMMRVRNPHQQCWVLSENGTVSIWNEEGPVRGWCTYKTNGGVIRDICTVADENGRDVPMLLVRRNVGPPGNPSLFLEAIPNFTENDRWDYSGSSTLFFSDTPTDTITGLEHLEGKRVIVYDQFRWVGQFIVEGGQVVLTDDAGGTTPMTFAVVGLPHQSVLWALPPNKDDMASASRYTDLTVRLFRSTRPIVNGERTKDRQGITNPMGLSPPVVYLEDASVYEDGWSRDDLPQKQLFEIKEWMPFRCEILGFTAKLTSNSL